MIEYSNTEILNLIDDYIHKQKYRKILKLRYIDGMTYQAIAEHPEIDMSVRQVQRIVYKYGDKILLKLKP